MLKSSLLILTLIATLPFSAFAAYLDDEDLGGESSLVQRTILQGDDVSSGTRFSQISVEISIDSNTSDGRRVAGCSGSLIAKDLVLTAGHCVKNIYDPSVKILAVTVYVAGQGFFGYRGKFVVRQWRAHPNFKGSSADTVVHDIALLKLEEPISGDVRVAEIPSSELPIGQTKNLIVAGYGDTSFGNHSSGLHSANVTGKMKVTADNEDHQILISGRQPCHGDSGGPVYQASGDHLAVVGVISHGQADCSGEGYGISVFSHLPWIKSTAKELRSQLNI